MAGLERKYEIRRRSDNREIDDGFVLRVRTDPAAWMAAWHYASLTRNAELRRDMREWLRVNIPTDAELGDEGSLNRDLLANIQQTIKEAAPWGMTWSTGRRPRL